MEVLPLRTALQACSYVVIACLLAIFVYTKISSQRTLNSLGGSAPQIRCFLPFGLDIIGRTIYDTMRHRSLENWHAMFAPHGSNCETVEASLLGLRCVFTMSSDNIKAILATQFEDYGKGSRFHKDWYPFLGDSIFTTDGAQWRASRQLLRPQFIKQRVSDLSLFEKHTQVLLNCVKNLGNGEKFDINDYFLRYTLDSVTDFLFGKSIDSLHNPLDAFSKAFAEVQRVQNVITKSGPASIFLPKSSFRSSLQIIDGFVNPFIDQALSTLSAEDELDSADKYTFLHALSGFTRDRKVLRDQIVAILLAGRDTTAAALSWTFYELARHPQIVRTLRREILEVVGFETLPTYEHLKSMRYLQASCTLSHFNTNYRTYSMRLYPLVPFNVRVALRDTSLPRGGGASGELPIVVLKDTMIAYSTLALHRRGKHSEEFLPERWFGKSPLPWTYIPFNGGPRTCVGQQFALAEMGYTVTRILQEFDRIENYMSSEPNMKAEIVLQPLHGVRIGLWRRQNLAEVSSD